MQIILDKRLDSRLAALRADSSPPARPTVGIAIGHVHSAQAGEPADAVVVAHLARCPRPETADGRGDDITLCGSTSSPRAEDAAERRRAAARAAGKQQPSAGADDLISATGDSDWLAHHCRQALRMLPGGLDIVGFVVSCDKRQYAALQPTLYGALRRCAKLSAQIGTMGARPPISDMIVLLLEPGASDVSAVHAHLPAGDTGAQVQTAGARLTQQHVDWHRLSARCALDPPFAMQLPDALHGAHFRKQFVSVFRPMAEMIHKSSLCLIDGQMRSADEHLVPETGGKGGKSHKSRSAHNFAVDILLPSLSALGDGDATASSTSASCGSMTLKCTVDCLALVPARPNVCVRHAVDAVKVDLVRSLYARAELHYESMCVVEGESSDPLAIHQLPRRVFIAADGRSSLVDLCDYLFESDGVDDVQDNAMHCLDVTVDVGQVRDSSEQVATADLLDKLGIMSLPAISDSGNEVSNESDTGSNYSARRLSLHAAALAESDAGTMALRSNVGPLLALGALLAAVAAVIAYYALAL